MSDEDEVTEGGSRLIRSNKKELSEMLGGPPEDNLKILQAREKLMDELFGECEAVSHEVLPLVPHIDVYVYKPGFQGRDFYTLVSSGMSDCPMTLPEGLPAEYARAEIILYTKELDEHCVNLVRHFARYPHQHDTYFSYEHTIPNGMPAEPFFEGSELDSVMFMQTILRSDRTYTERLKASTGYDVQLLHMEFLTTAECELKLQRGSDGIYDLFEKNRHHFVLNEGRKSYV